MPTHEDEFPDIPPPLTRQNARLTAEEHEIEDPPSSDEEDEDPVAFLILLAVLAAIQLKHTTPKPVMRPWSSLTKRR